MRLLAGSALVVIVLGVAACGSSDQPSSDGTKTGTASCEGGDIRILQGQPTDLPGGGSVGIGQVSDADPVTVRLVLGGADSGETASKLAVGDRFTVRGASYEITCISPGKVTARSDS